MMKTKIFLDSGDPEETRDILPIIGSLDGQTTNPSLFAKNPQVQARLSSGNKFSQNEIYEFYKKIINEIALMIPNGSISIEVYADKKTAAKKMIKQALALSRWIPNCHIKLPVTKAGLEAAEILVKKNININMTLCFSQKQAAAVYIATKGAKKGQVFISPFVGRLDDQGSNGLDFINNCLKMYKNGDGHVEVLVASIRNLDHLLTSFSIGADIVTVPYKILKEWKEKTNMNLGQDYQTPTSSLKKIEYEKIDLNKSWREFDIRHQLTDAGIDKFCADWNQLLKV